MTLIIFWEVLPITCITSIFWHIPHSAKKITSQKVPYSLNNSDTFVFYIPNSHQKGSIFNNPNRYDSDEAIFSSQSEYRSFDFNTTRFSGYNTDIIDYSSSS